MPNLAEHHRPAPPSGAGTPSSLPAPPAPLDAAFDPTGQGATPTPLQRLWALLRPERGDLLAVLAFAVTIGVLGLATPIAVQAIVNSVAAGGLLQPLMVIAALLFVVLSFAGLLVAIQTWTVELLQRRLFVRVVADLAARLPRVQLAAYDSGHGPELVNRFFDLITIQKAAPKLLIDALGMVLAVLVGLTVLAFYHPLLLAFDILLLCAIALIVLAPLGRGERTAIEESGAKYDVAAWLEEVASSPFSFRAGGSSDWILKGSDELTGRWVDARRKHFRALFGQVLAAVSLQVVASTLLLGIGGYLVIRGSLSLGQLVAAELIVTAVVSAVAKMGKHLETWYDLMSAVSKVGALLDVPLEQTPGEAVDVGSSEGASLEFDDVSWLGSDDRAALSGITLRVRPGERVGIAGLFGRSGSVLAELLWRMREPATGAIRFDGRDLRDLDAAQLRGDIGVASPVEVVRGTVRENVSLRRPGITGDHVRAALEAVGLDDRVSAFPQGLDTPLYPYTRLLSDSERQLLMLARAIAGQPSLLALDSLLDRALPGSRRRLMDSLFGADRPWTLLVVSDLPEVLDRCDRVLHLQPPGAPVVAGPRPAEVS